MGRRNEARKVMTWNWRLQFGLWFFYSTHRYLFLLAVSHFLIAKKSKYLILLWCQLTYTYTYIFFSNSQMMWDDQLCILHLDFVWPPSVIPNIYVRGTTWQRIIKNSVTSVIDIVQGYLVNVSSVYWQIVRTHQRYFININSRQPIYHCNATIGILSVILESETIHV